MIILLDMDGVMADFNAAALEMYNFLTNENVVVEQIKTPQTGKHVGDPTLLRKIVESPGFMRNLQPIDGAIEGVEYLHGKGHDIVFVSNATNCPTSGHEKRDWLKYYFSKVWKYAPLILTKQKYRVRGDVLIDDDPKNFVGLHESTKALLYNHSYNAHVVGFERVYGWDHILDWVARNDIIK